MFPQKIDLKNNNLLLHKHSHQPQAPSKPEGQRYVRPCVSSYVVSFSAPAVHPYHPAEHIQQDPVLPTYVSPDAVSLRTLLLLHRMTLHHLWILRHPLLLLHLWTTLRPALYPHILLLNHHTRPDHPGLLHRPADLSVCP